jgi:hypothetical protein
LLQCTHPNITAQLEPARAEGRTRSGALLNVPSMVVIVAIQALLVIGTAITVDLAAAD